MPDTAPRSARRPSQPKTSCSPLLETCLVITPVQDGAYLLQVTTSQLSRSRPCFILHVRFVRLISNFRGASHDELFVHFIDRHPCVTAASAAGGTVWTCLFCRARPTFQLTDLDRGFAGPIAQTPRANHFTACRGYLELHWRWTIQHDNLSNEQLAGILRDFPHLRSLLPANRRRSQAPRSQTVAPTSSGQRSPPTVTQPRATGRTGAAQRARYTPITATNVPAQTQPNPRVRMLLPPQRPAPPVPGPAVLSSGITKQAASPARKPRPLERASPQAQRETSQERRQREARKRIDDAVSAALEARQKARHGQGGSGSAV